MYSYFSEIVTGAPEVTAARAQLPGMSNIPSFSRTSENFPSNAHLKAVFD